MSKVEISSNAGTELVSDESVTSPFETVQPSRCVLLNTRCVTVRLAPGVSPQRLVTLLNERYVRLNGEQLIEGRTGEVLGYRPAVLAVNRSDYELAEEHVRGWELDTLDPYGFKYNEI